MSAEEWESLCDGCGLCCLHKLQDEDTGEIFYTDVACRLLDLDCCRCTRYADRHRLVADCVRLTKDNLDELEWMPETCAYRRIYEGKPLPAWHRLITGDAESVHRAGASIKGRAVGEDHVHDDEIVERVVHWAGVDGASVDEDG